MELTKAINKDSFDPTPKLKSSPVPMLFIPFDINEIKCKNCGFEYSYIICGYQKYCKNCLTWYTKNLPDNQIYLDVHIGTNNTPCGEHEPRNSDFHTQNIQEWCVICSEILYFRQIKHSYGLLRSYNFFYMHHQKIFGNCQLCGKYFSFYDNSYNSYICSNCYLISSGRICSFILKVPIPILYLPWWDTIENCIACKKNLKTEADCQKWCSNCTIIYTGCRYCLTTNIILGMTDHSPCKKCNRKLIITIDFTKFIVISFCGNSNIDEFLYRTRINNIHQFTNCVNTDKSIDANEYYKSEVKFNINPPKPMIEWIPYSQITNFKKIAEGGFGIVYKAFRLNPDNNQYEIVAIKRFLNSHNISKTFLNELKSLYQCNNTDKCIIKYHGITQDPNTKEFMLIMEYAYEGDLYNYLQNNFNCITWIEKLIILDNILQGLQIIHENNLIHRDLHSGNILSCKKYHWNIGDLGLSQPANISSSNNEIYGVIPYIAPEIFNGANFSKESDIYSLGMIMWELTSGFKPFANYEHNTDLIYEIIDGKRPEITEDTPICFANLMKRCWDPDPLKRPLIEEFSQLRPIIHDIKKIKQFQQSEEKRFELIQSMKLGPDKPHPKAIFTSRALRSLISKSLSVNLSLPNLSNKNQEYISREYEIDINSF